MKKFLAVLLSLSLLFPLPAIAADQAGLLQKIEALSKELDSLKQQMQEMQKKETAKEERITVVEKKAEETASAWPSWLEISGDYRGRFDYLKGTVHDHFLLFPAGRDTATNLPIFRADNPRSMVRGYDVKNAALMTNRFGLNLGVKATEDIRVTARLLMYKAWGHQTPAPIQGAFFADRAFGAFDGTVGHVPTDSILRVDRAFATWSNIAGQPIWFSIGRRPSTKGAPGNLRQNLGYQKEGTAGVPSFLVDYAFDGLTIGAAPYIEALPGAYAKICFGKGFDSGFESLAGNTIKDVYMLGLNVVPYNTENLQVELQFNRAFNIFDNMPDMGVRTNLGDIDQYGLLVMKRFDNVGIGSLNLFAAGGLSRTHPNNNMFTFRADFSAFGGPAVNTGAGLLYDDPAMGGTRESRTGNIIYLGARYDIERTGTKIGIEYNRGSKYWIAFAPAGDDIWTSKLGTRGDVFEGYIIQDLNLKPIAKEGRAFFRLGYQYYDFKYTGSNSWIGAPKKISDLTAADSTRAQMFQPIDKAHNIYLTFDVLF